MAARWAAAYTEPNLRLAVCFCSEAKESFVPGGPRLKSSSFFFFVVREAYCCASGKDRSTAAVCFAKDTEGKTIELDFKKGRRRKERTGWPCLIHGRAYCVRNSVGLPSPALPPNGRFGIIPREARPSIEDEARAVRPHTTSLFVFLSFVFDCSPFEQVKSTDRGRFPSARISSRCWFCSVCLNA